MDTNKFNKILKEIKSAFLLNKKILKDIINKELENGCIIDFDDCLNYIETITQDILEGKVKEEKDKKIAIVYNGNPEVTIKSIIISIYFNNKLSLYPESYNIFVAGIVELINQVLKDFDLKEKIMIIEENQEEDLIYKQNEYSKIKYIGDYFECKNIEYYINREIEYNSFGFLKVYINRSKYKEEYKELMKYTYKRNISVEYFDDIEEILESVNKKDTVLIYEEKENLEIIIKKIKTKNIYTKENFYEEYKFLY